MKLHESVPFRELKIPEMESALRKGMTEYVRREISRIDEFENDSAYVSLYARSCEKDGNWLEAAKTWDKARNVLPEIHEFNIRYWENLVKLAKEEGVNSDSLKAIVQREGESHQEGKSLGEMKLAYSAAAMLEDSLADDLADRIVEHYPSGELAYDIVGERFWGGLYPIWRDDSAKVGYLKEFIDKYDQFTWCEVAWRTLISSYSRLQDTAQVIQTLDDWVDSDPENPVTLMYAASYALDYPNELERAHKWALESWNKRVAVTRPPHMPPEEWELYENSIPANIPLKLAEVHFKEGGLDSAWTYANKSLELANYGMDEYATQAPQHYLLGKIAHARGDSGFIDHWIEALVQGDVRNHYAGLADSSLREVFDFKNNLELIDYCRMKTGYGVQNRGLGDIVFTEISDSIGLGEAGGSRFAWGDFDKDNDDDLLINGSRLYRNDEGLFVEVSEDVGLIAPGCRGGIWGDYDNDGWIDLFCFSSSGELDKAERLFHNEGGTFSDVTASSGAIQDTFSTEAAIWGDFSCDGRLDLYVAGYERPAGSADDLGNGWPDRLLVQGEDGVFHDHTEKAGMIPPYGKHLCGRSPVACDFDYDGRLDLYVGNYRLQQNLLWRNRVNLPVNGKHLPHRSELQDIKIHIPKYEYSEQAGLYMVDGEEVDGWWGHTIGCQWGDYDNDGDFDLIVCNLAHPRYIGFSNRTMLYKYDHEKNGGVFKDVRYKMKIKYDECHSEPVWGDFDNDGDLDLYITCVYPNRRSYLYRNDGDRFTDVTFLSGTRVFNGWGSAVSDYDNDGDLDLVTRNDGKVAFFRNDTKGGNWIEIAWNGPSLGSKIGQVFGVHTRDDTHVRQIEGGKGAGNQCSQVMHIGLGEATSCSVQMGDRFLAKEPAVINRKLYLGRDLMLAP